MTIKIGSPTDVTTTAGDSANKDAFSRQRVSSSTYVFDGQFTYDLQPLLYEQLTNGSGAAITHDTTNRCALMTLSSTPTGGYAYMQTFEHFRYTAGRSQLIFLTFNFIEGVADCLKFAGYSDGTEGVELQLNGTTVQLMLRSTTTNGNQTVAKSNWNVDKLDGTGPSKIVLDLTKTQILVIDLQALYVGRVRVGFDIDGTIVYCHTFKHANRVVTPYIKTANLPLRVGMSCTGTVSTTMLFICNSVMKEDGSVTTEGYHFSQDSLAVVAADTARTHALSIQPRTTFNGIVNRAKFVLNSVSIVVVGNYPVHWELCLGAAITGTTTFIPSNTTYSTIEYNQAGTFTGTPAVILGCGFVPASNQSRGAERISADLKYPICLDAAGTARLNGRLSLLVSGLGGNSTCYSSITWTEVR